MSADPALDGPLLSWVSQWDDAALRLRAGANTVERGAADARDRAVGTVTTTEQGRVVLATVRGGADLLLIGTPAYGAAVSEPDRLLLAPLDRVLDQATQRLLEHGPVRVLAKDLPHFLTHVYPAER